MQPILQGTIIWSLLCHENINPLLGVATFDDGLSTVTGLTGRSVEMQTIMCRTHGLIPDPLCVKACDVVRLLILICSQLLGIARGLHYLHGHALGPIYHGDVRGVSFSLQVYYYRCTLTCVSAQCPRCW